jgi:hypothetical protein
VLALAAGQAQHLQLSQLTVWLAGNRNMLCCRIHNADIHLTEDYDLDDLVDVIEGSRVYIPAIYVVNKIDQITLEELEVMDKLPHYCAVRWGQGHNEARWCNLLAPWWINSSSFWQFSCG